MKAMASTGFGMWVQRAAVASLVVGGIALSSGSAEARDDSNPEQCAVDPMSMNAIVCTIGGGSSPSSFLGAFASDNGGAGGWTEFYGDDDGEWWVEHHKDGSTTVGWEAALGGGNFMSGPKLLSNKEGTYSNKKRPALKGTKGKGARRTFAAAKASAKAKTGSLDTVAPSSNVVIPGTFGAFAKLQVGGSGKCSASFVVKKNGAVVSSTPDAPVTLPMQRIVALPSSAANYTIEAVGKDGCLGQARSTTVSVQTKRY